ncbi:MAG: alpha/beta fold hydrolase [Actinobacteria bacterium]|nr:alpha/beta fold hydrolase [Actinomycetota bacterium]
MEVLRTPDSCFEGLAEWPYAPVYTQVPSGEGSTLRIHHVDQGPKTAAHTILCMHGEPSWAYLYRKMIRGFVAAGHRVIAPDLIGFGRSDKPAAMADYTYERHVAWMSDWLVANDLSKLTLVCQDWGGLIGLRLVAAFPDRFARIVTANTFLPTGDRDPGAAFRAWREYSQATPDFNVGNIVQGGCASRPIGAHNVAAYDAPYPDDSYKAGARIFPTLVPASPDDPSAGPNQAAWKVLVEWTRPFLTAFGDSDPITAGADRHFQKLIPGAAGQPHTTIVGGGHFIQEDKGDELAAIVNDFIARDA